MQRAAKVLRFTPLIASMLLLIAWAVSLGTSFGVVLPIPGSPWLLAIRGNLVLNWEGGAPERTVTWRRNSGFISQMPWHGQFYFGAFAHPGESKWSLAVIPIALPLTALTILAAALHFRLRLWMLLAFTVLFAAECAFFAR